MHFEDVVLLGAFRTLSQLAGLSDEFHVSGVAPRLSRVSHGVRRHLWALSLDQLWQDGLQFDLHWEWDRVDFLDLCRGESS